MFDLGTSLLASVARDPEAIAIIDGETRFTYRAWLERIAALVAGFDALGLKLGDHLLTVLQNRWEAATVHWACQLAGIIITPLNWRAKAEEVQFCIDDAEARAVIYQDVSADAVAGATHAAGLPRIAVGEPGPGDVSFQELLAGSVSALQPRASADSWSLMLYTSGTTGRPKGVPRRHRAERAAALAHVAQNLYARGERTLGVMPLYHTMGVRSLLAMSLVGGCFVCLPRFDAGAVLELIARERLTNLYLVPTLYHDLVAHARIAETDLRSVRKLGFAGAPMSETLLRRVTAVFEPALFVNHYGSSEVYTCTVNTDAVAKPGSAGRAGLNAIVRVIRLTATQTDQMAAIGEEGEITVSLSSDEAFEGYWRRPEADAKALRDGWYLTGDTGFVDADGDLFVTGRVDDMIITGGENVSPVEVENCLASHPAVAEVAVAGLPDARLGQIVAAFIKPVQSVAAAELDQHCRASGLADFKRPRRFVFVAELPKSPVGKVLRRKLTGMADAQMGGNAGLAERSSARIGGTHDARGK